MSEMGPIALVELSWHVGFTPDFGRMVATHRTDASGPLPDSCTAAKYEEVMRRVQPAGQFHCGASQSR
jgi:hypothetical protein